MDDINPSAGYIAKTLKKDNVEVVFVHGGLSDTKNHTKEIIGEVDMAMSMFAPIACIPGRNNRQKAMRNLADLSSGDVIISVPNILPNHNDRINNVTNVDKYKKFIDEGKPYKLAKEHGDIYYQRAAKDGKEIEHYIHIYSPQELEEDLNAAGLVPDRGIEAEKIMTEGELSNLAKEGNTVRIGIDALEAKYMDKNKVENNADYLIATSPGLREHKKDSSFRDKVVKDRSSSAQITPY